MATFLCKSYESEGVADPVVGAVKITAGKVAQEAGQTIHDSKDGRVVRLVKVQGGQGRVEHFWLCGECFRLHDFLEPASTPSK
jgi:hypothetical protein